MKLSIIIVNYNVKFFLEQCLLSVKQAIKDLDVEVFVVDNNSVDGSCIMVKEKFPEITLIENKSNVGFAKANNQAIKISSGKYILLLNPDTVVEEDSFAKCIQFMDKNSDAGGLSVKMIDGAGKFLPESKRALPTPMVSFYKIFGFSKIFPKSKKFARYHLGHLDNSEIHEIEILPGAYMFLRKEVLEQTGYLDETFFMYGEDIDLSYRILKAGHKNYYYPETTIIHYKGESTKKGSINYVMVFYKAMIIFAKKHFSKSNAQLYSFFINIAIYFRALLAIFHRVANKIFLPLLDATLIYTFYYLIKPIWEHYKFHGEGSYPPEFMQIVVPSYIAVWLLSLLVNGAYNEKLKPWNPAKGIIVGSTLLLIIYALLPEHLRFSRALLLIGSLSALFITYLNRLLFHAIPFFKLQIRNNKFYNTIIVGSLNEANRISSFLGQTTNKHQMVGVVFPQESTYDGAYLGNITQINEVIRIHKINEIIFCSKDMAANSIIHYMLILSKFDINFKIAQPDSVSIIGSNSSDSPGELYTIELNSITKDSNIRLKRSFDIITSCLFFLVGPILVLAGNRFKQLYSNIFSVLKGESSWVGYSSIKYDDSILPKIKPGIFTTATDKISHTDPSIIEKLDMAYAKDYTLLKDFMILIKNLNKIG